MRIAYISNEYPPQTGFGGIGTYTRHMAEAMAARGHDVCVFCRSSDNSTGDSIVNGVSVRRLTGGTYPLPGARWLYPVRVLARALLPQTLVRLAWAREAAAHLRDFVARDGHPFDIVEFPECGGEGAAIPPGKYGRTVVRLHTPWEMIRALDRIKEGRIDSLILGFTERYAAARADAVTSPTRSLLDMMTGRWKLTKGTVIPNPIPSGLFPRSTGQRWIYTGRVEHRKGVHVLVRGYADLCTRRDPPPLLLVGRPYGVMAGGEDYGSHILRLIQEHHLTRRIEWIQGVAPDEVPGLLSQASVAVYPSLWENLPYTCMEAMASGLAVVASRCGGYEEMITHDASGLLFPPGDGTALSNTLQRLLDDPGLVARLQSSARERVRTTYDTAIVAPRMETFYTAISQQGHRHG